MVCFQTKNPSLGNFWRVFWIVNVSIFYDHLEYFMPIWYNLWTFDIVCGHLLYFFPIWYVWTKKNLSTLVGQMSAH
jgi:hypothetical protein